MSLLAAQDKIRTAMDLNYCAFLAVTNSLADEEEGRDAVQATLNAAHHKLDEVISILDELRKQERI